MCIRDRFGDLFISFDSDFTTDESNGPIQPRSADNAFNAQVTNLSGGGRSCVYASFTLTNTGNVDQMIPLTGGTRMLTIPANGARHLVAELLPGFIIQADENGLIGLNTEDDLTDGFVLPANVTISRVGISR